MLDCGSHIESTIYIYIYITITHSRPKKKFTWQNHVRANVSPNGNLKIQRTWPQLVPSEATLGYSCYYSLTASQDSFSFSFKAFPGVLLPKLLSVSTIYVCIYIYSSRCKGADPATSSPSLGFRITSFSAKYLTKLGHQVIPFFRKLLVFIEI